MASGVTVTLGLDPTIVLLTQVVLVTATRLRMSPKPDVYATAHLANSASLLLPISNLTNLLVFNLPFRLILRQQTGPICALSTIRYTWSVDPELTMAGTLLRQARKRAGLSQVDLASRAGITQSVISAYESGQRQPSLPALARLIDAAGFELTLGLRRPPGRLRRLSGPVGRRVRRHREDLVAAAAAHG